MSRAPDAAQADNLSFLEELYAAYLQDPTAVTPDYRAWFAELQEPPDRPASEDATVRELRLSELVDAYRTFGHRAAHLDPLSPRPDLRRELRPETYGLAEADLDRTFETDGIFGLERATLRDVLARLQQTYCRYIGAETQHIEDASIQGWLHSRMEATQNRLALTRDEQLRLLTKLTDAEVFEQFIHAKFLGEKRFSLEGAESLIPMMDAIVEESARRGVTDFSIGMAHRGRLNVLANILAKPAAQIFREFSGLDADKMIGSGDVKYHLGYSAEREVAGHRARVSLAFNPSHLEAIYPVVEGRVRARQDHVGDTTREKCLAIVIHGDAAFAGQGVVAEVLNFSGLDGYTTGGTLHIVVNNQLGFTTSTSDARSSLYATGVARMLDIPIFHVNGEDPESVAQVVRLAVEFRQRFHRDVVIDLYCYRKYGHNEGDEPRYTQPLMYAAIDRRPTVRHAYVQHLQQGGFVSEEQSLALVQARREALEEQLARSKAGPLLAPAPAADPWTRYRGGRDVDTPDVHTGLSKPVLQALARKVVRWPEGFEPHPKLRRGPLTDRLDMAEGRRPLDYGMAEQLAFASLLEQGVRVRLSGQDVERGTFSHRHSVLVDHRTGVKHVPLCHLSEKQGVFEVRNSPLSEYGVLGFEYGYSIDSPDALVVWEAQFGDFFNTGQVIVDQFLGSAEDKWNKLCGLVLLLPHGYEGQGPEHSSARIERFLTQSAEDNWQVCHLSTPAQYFHALRRQVLRPWRKPLICFTPKSLLRGVVPDEAKGTLDGARSPLEEFEGEFQRVLGDRTVEPRKVRRVLLCSGKIYWELRQARHLRKIDDVAIVRLEQMYPYPQAELSAELARYPNATKLVWVQEEPWNMGGWYYLRARDQARQSDDSLPLYCVSRPESASPATGAKKAHDIEQAAVVDAAFAHEDAAVRPVAALSQPGASPLRTAT